MLKLFTTSTINQLNQNKNTLLNSYNENPDQIPISRSVIGNHMGSLIYYLGYHAPFTHNAVGLLQQ